MLNLVSPTSKQISSTSCEEDIHAQWKFYQSHGYSYHQNQQFSKAITCFKASCNVSWDLVRHHTNHTTNTNAWDLLFNATHNLSACYNAIGNNREGTRLLKELHQETTRTIKDNSQPRSQRLSALAILDKSLFSLASQLAYENKTNELHQLIMTTESIADQASYDLLTQTEI